MMRSDSDGALPTAEQRAGVMPGSTSPAMERARQANAELDPDAPARCLRSRSSSFPLRAVQELPSSCPPPDVGTAQRADSAGEASSDEDETRV